MPHHSLCELGFLGADVPERNSVLVIDCQATAAAAARGHVLEIHRSSIATCVGIAATRSSNASHPR